MDRQELAQLSPGALTMRLYTIRGQERELLVEFLHYLGEVERRKLFLEMGYSTLFVFLVEYLGYPRSSAFRRSAAST